MQDKVVVLAERYSAVPADGTFPSTRVGIYKRERQHPGQTCHHLDRNTTGIPLCVSSLGSIH